MFRTFLLKRNNGRRRSASRNASRPRAHDRVRRSTDLPLFFGRANKDTISARLLVDRIETAAQIAGWNDDARKLQEMYMILGDRAVVWWRSLPDAGIDRVVWDDVKNEFLAMYEPRRHAPTFRIWCNA